MLLKASIKENPGLDGIHCWIPPTFKKDQFFLIYSTKEKEMEHHKVRFMKPLFSKHQNQVNIQLKKKSTDNFF